MTYKHYSGILLSMTGVIALLFFSTLYPKTSVTNAFVYQGITLVLSLTLIGAARVLLGKFRYLQIGDITAKTTPVKVFSITERDNWKRFGTTLLVCISTGTLIFMVIAAMQKPTPIALTTLALAFTLSIPLSLVNAFNEEIITRWLIVETLKDSTVFRWSPWLSAMIFGIPHFLGTPGGVIGACMAGFMGWLLTRSIQDTRGVFWAVLIHCIQDVIIITAILFPLL